jgi:ubiquitin
VAARNTGELIQFESLVDTGTSHDTFGIDGGAIESGVNDPNASGDAGEPGSINPSDFIGTGTTDQPAKSRKPRSDAGKKRGERKPSPATSAAKIGVSGLELTLLSLHAMAAAALDIEAIALDEKEAHDLAQAIANVQRHYTVFASEKQQDQANLIFLMAGLYGIKGVAVAKVLKDRAANAKARQPQQQ